MLPSRFCVCVVLCFCELSVYRKQTLYFKVVVRCVYILSAQTALLWDYTWNVVVVVVVGVVVLCFCVYISISYVSLYLIKVGIRFVNIIPSPRLHEWDYIWYVFDFVYIRRMRRI